jgi:radical SAM superfamily enzyme YgiQ (UPF0313 family)
MKTILTTLNSKFIHSCLSIRYLQTYVKDLVDVEIKEFTINQNKDFIAAEIYKEKPEVIGFSTYIWNLKETFEICEILKLVNPKLKIILGGPEVSYDSEQILEENPFIDFIIYGEGEDTFKELMEKLISNETNYSSISGMVFRGENKIIKTPPRPLIKNLDIIPSPYKDIGKEFENKIVYYESSRGCPFNCEFCLSSTIKGVRFFSLERVKEDLDSLIEGKVRQVKFVDRTFNANKKYAMEIMEFIMEKNPLNINFHFEVTAHLLDDEMLDFLSGVKEGLFQFEVGVQSTNLDTIEAIGRTTDFKKLKAVTEEVKSFKNIHQHLDLIAGLPYEGYNSFRNSFNDVYDIKPEKIQLGFLKLLKGSGLRKNQDKYGYKYLDVPPYEVLESKYISYEGIIRLKGIEDLVEKYYNEGYFENSLEYLIKNHYKTPFDLYEDFLIYWEERGYHQVSHSRNRLYEILLEYYKERNFEDIIIFSELVKYDYIINNRNPNIPNFFTRVDEDLIQKNIHEILKDDRLLENYLYEYKEQPTKKIINKIIVEGFKVDILKIIEEGYNPIDEYNSTYILFNYREGVINRCITYNISEIVKEMI